MESALFRMCSTEKSDWKVNVHALKSHSLIPLNCAWMKNPCSHNWCNWWQWHCFMWVINYLYDKECARLESYSKGVLGQILPEVLLCCFRVWWSSLLWWCTLCWSKQGYIKSFISSLNDIYMCLYRMLSESKVSDVCFIFNTEWFNSMWHWVQQPLYRQVQSLV